MKSIFKKFLLLLIFLFHFSFSRAQRDSSMSLKDAFFFAGAGIAVAPETLLQPSITDRWHDYVKPGFNFMASAGAPVFHVKKIELGVTVQFNYSYCGFDMNKYLAFLKSGGSSSSIYTNGGYGVFTEYTYVAGVYADFILGKIILQLKVAGGAGNTVLPNCAYTISNPPPLVLAETFTQTYSTKPGYAFDVGFQIIYQFSRHFSARYNSDIINSDFHYNNELFTSRNIKGIVNPSGVANMIMFNASLGLSYNFTRK